MTLDPYLIKRVPKWHWKRLTFTAWAKLSDLHSRLFFQEYEIPMIDRVGEPGAAPDACWDETQVTPQQALALADNCGECVVEVGAWRGVTTEYLAAATDSPVVAIDPFIGSANETNLRRFMERTAALGNVTLRRETFGQAVRNWNLGPARFIFIDAAHDYVNVSHDLAAAMRITKPGAILALHDVDDRRYAGCRRAVYERLERFELIAHIPNLVIVRRS
jgi:hypothetical protein